MVCILPVIPLAMQMREGLQYNPYFPGGAIAMPKMLNDGAIEYEDGTPATEAQVILLIHLHCVLCCSFICQDINSHILFPIVFADGKRCSLFLVLGC